MAKNDTTVVTEATWKPGLPPPIEALQANFPPDQGHVIDYGIWIERDRAAPDGWRQIPIATVTMADGREITFFPTKPSSLPMRGNSLPRTSRRPARSTDPRHGTQGSTRKGRDDCDR